MQGAVCCAKSLLSCLTLVNLQTVIHQAPLSMGLSRKQSWRGLPCPSPGSLPDPGIETMSLTSPALVGRFFTTSTTGHLQCSEYSPKSIQQNHSSQPVAGFPHEMWFL